MSQTASITPEKSDEEVWIPCASYSRVTSHKALVGVRWADSSPDGDITVWRSYWVVTCQGCRAVSFCIEETCTEDVDRDPETGEEFLRKTHTLYPSRVAGRPEMGSIREVPFGISSICREIRAALCSDQPILTGIGIRAIVEAVCNNRGATGSNLEKRIDNLDTMKIVTEDGAKILHSLRFMGNDAAHEVKAHTTEELNIAFGVVEYLLHGGVHHAKTGSEAPTKEKTRLCEAQECTLNKALHLRLALWPSLSKSLATP